MGALEFELREKSNVSEAFPEAIWKHIAMLSSGVYCWKKVNSAEASSNPVLAIWPARFVDVC